MGVNAIEMDKHKYSGLLCGKNKNIFARKSFIYLAEQAQKEIFTFGHWSQLGTSYFKIILDGTHISQGAKVVFFA